MYIALWGFCMYFTRILAAPVSLGETFDPAVLRFQGWFQGNDYPTGGRPAL
jgi:hypothetical protein